MASLDGLQDTRILVGPDWTAVTSLGGEVPGWQNYKYLVPFWPRLIDSHNFLNCIIICFMMYAVPSTVMVAEAVDGLLLATVHVYSPPLVTIRV